MPADRASQNERRRRRLYAERKAAGLCVWCGRPATHGGIHCGPCRVRNRGYFEMWWRRNQERFNAKRREQRGDAA